MGIPLKVLKDIGERLYDYRDVIKSMRCLCYIARIKAPYEKHTHCGRCASSESPRLLWLLRRDKGISGDEAKVFRDDGVEREISVLT